MTGDPIFPFDDTADFAAAERGFIGALEPGVVRNEAGAVVWDNDCRCHPRDHTAGQAACRPNIHPAAGNPRKPRSLTGSRSPFLSNDASDAIPRTFRCVMYECRSECRSNSGGRPAAERVSANASFTERFVIRPQRSVNQNAGCGSAPECGRTSS